MTGNQRGTVAGVDPEPPGPGILIIDDSLTVRMDLCEAFQAAGLSPTPCATLAEARRLLAERSFEIVVLDVLLPDGDGVELLQEIRTDARCSRTAVLMLSSESEIADRVRALRTGADAYVGKPYDITYVLTMAQELIAPAEVRGDARRVLVVDDSPTVRAQLEEALAADGYEVLVAHAGQEGLRVAAARRPHAVIVDGSLPDIDGATVIRRLRLDAALRTIPCLLLTGSEDGDAELRALDAGADAFVRKTQDTSVITAKLSALLRRTAGPDTDTSSLLAPKKILAVDDSPTYLHEVADLLSSRGYHVVLARSGEEALDLLAVESVDCILLDRVMPGLSGDETCRRIKATTLLRDIPLIMVTGVDGTDSLLDALSTGADDYISKSGEIEVLEARIRAQLRRKQFTDENRTMREQLLRAQIEAAEARTVAQQAQIHAALDRERALNVANAELRELDRLKTQFIASVSHELRTPLTSIRGYIEILLDTAQADGDPCVNMFEVIDRNAQRLLNLVEDLLVLAKNDAPVAAVESSTMDLTHLVENAIAVLAPVCLRASVEIINTIDVPLPVDGDRIGLERVLLNVLSNAVKFSNTGDTVVVRGGVVQEHVVVTISDTGIGIPADELPHVFTRFFRSDADAAHSIPGTGLGLAVVHETVHLHGGAVSVESTVGRGTTVTVRLPLSTNRTWRRVPAPAGTSPASAGTSPASAVTSGTTAPAPS
jgi:two-component system, NtrC family, sensor kinase